MIAYKNKAGGVTLREASLVGAFLILLCPDPLVAVGTRLHFGTPFTFAGLIAGVLFFLAVADGQSSRMDSGKKLGSFAAIYVSLLLFAAISVLVHPENATKLFDLSFVYNGVDYLFLPSSGLFMALAVLLCGSMERLCRVLRIVSWVLAAYLLLRFLSSVVVRGYWSYLGSNGETVERSYSVDFGHDALMVALLFAFLFFEERRLRYLVAGAILAICIAVGGGRGALLFLVVGVTALYYYYHRSNPVLLIFVSGGILLLIMGFDLVLDLMIHLLDALGFSSRTLTRLAEGTAMSDSGRDAIQALAWDQINSGGFFGYGLYGDRYYLGKEFYWGYPHNVFLECAITFGIVPSIVIISLVLIFLFRAFISSPKSSSKGLMIVFAVNSLQLLVSYSFWYSTAFWALIGLALLCKPALRTIAVERH